MHDLVVAGGGPAGLAVALAAARAGMDVVVCERREGVIDKACGEGLMPRALRHLQALGVDPPGHDLRGITYRQNGAVAHADFRRGLGRGVRRTELHAALGAAVARAGVPVLTRSVTEFTETPDVVRAGGLTARYLVAADGLHSPLRAAAGLGVDDPATPATRRSTGRHAPRWGLRRHYRLPGTPSGVGPTAFSDSVEVFWAPHSEAYVTPVAPTGIGVAILSSLRGGFDAQLSAFPELQARLTGWEAGTDIRGAGPLRQRARGRVAGRVLLVGDAAGYVDALTGEGLALAFAAATALVQCVGDGRTDDYERAWLRLSRRSRWLTSGLLWTRERTMLAPHLVPFAARQPRLFTRAVDEIGR